MRVLVTRPQADAERTARALAARGHEAVIAPVLRITSTGNAAPGPFEAAILTSANAVPALASLGERAKALPVFVVGERTASAVAEAGCRHVRMAAGDAASLAELVATAAAPGSKLLFVAGRDRKPEPEGALVAAGFDLVTWVAYEAVAAERLPGAAHLALQNSLLDAVLHYSRRSASVLLGLTAAAELTAEFFAIAHVCLSADTATPLRAAGVPLVMIAARPHEDALVATLEECTGKFGQTGSRVPQSG
jgi:uroporphyrinogen-III synthase